MQSSDIRSADLLKVKLQLESKKLYKHLFVSEEESKHRHDVLVQDMRKKYSMKKTVSMG